jgi:hypothetical protein
MIYVVTVGCITNLVTFWLLVHRGSRLRDVLAVVNKAKMSPSVDEVVATTSASANGPV